MIIGIDASRASAAQMTGTERYSREIIRALIHSHAHTFRLYARDTGELPAGPHITHVPIARSRLWTHLGLAGEIAKNPPDALFIPAHVLPLRFLSGALKGRVRSVVTLHDCGYKHFAGAHTFEQRLYLDASTRFSARHASALIADSETTRADLTRFYGVAPEKVTVAHPGPVPLPAISDIQGHGVLARQGLRPGGYVLHVGTLQPRKNLRRLLLAWSQLQRDGVAGGMQLVLAGGAGWGDENLALEAQKLGVAASVKLPGYVSDEDKTALLRHARAYAFPSLHEGFGFPVLEAQAAGLPLVCSDASSLPEVAGDGALFFPARNIDALAAALRRAISDEGLRADLAARGRRNLARFSWEACARIVLGVITARPKAHA